MSNQSTQLTKAAQIESKIDKQVAGSLTISREGGGMAFRDMQEVMEFAKMMSVSQQAVPPHCRNQPGICLGITIRAIEWRMSPFSVANKSYLVNDRIGYESQLIHAVIEQRAPIQARLRHEFTGSGPTRRCRVWATARGETEPLEYISPEFQTIQPKNSPLWKTKPDLQLYYNTSRDWARVYFPDVIEGVYSDDELMDMAGQMGRMAPPENLNQLADRLTAGTTIGTSHEQADDQAAIDELEAGEYVDAPHSDEDLVQDGREPERSPEQSPEQSPEKPEQTAQATTWEQVEQQASGKKPPGGELFDNTPQYE